MNTLFTSFKYHILICSLKQKFKDDWIQMKIFKYYLFTFFAKKDKKQQLCFKKLRPQFYDEISNMSSIIVLAI